MRIGIAGGNNQAGLPQQVLPLPLVVRVLDQENLPVEGIAVEWSTRTGSVSPASSPTDEKGEAHTTWALGATPGRAYLDAAISGHATVRFTAEARPRTTGGWGLISDVVTPFSVPTYDGSGQVVHPDFVATPDGAMVRGRHLAITPYPGGNANYENPSIFASSGALGWQLEPGTPNPLVRPGAGYLSDPDVVFVPESHDLWMYYREVVNANIIRLIRSTDGVHWGAPRQVLSAPNHRIISPSVVYRGPGDWLMWSIDGGAVGCAGSSTGVQLRKSSDGITWSAPFTIQLGQQGLWPWHIDVQWITERQEFWALYNAKQPGNCATPAVFLATSRDGVDWTTYPQPVLVKGAYPSFNDIVYRSTFAYDPQAQDVIFWYSGAKYVPGRGYAWSAAAERTSVANLFTRITASGAPLRANLFQPPPAELTDWP